jgi:hypothetical protein
VVDWHEQALVPVVVQPQHEKGFVCALESW